LWKIASSEGQQWLARSFFEEAVFDLAQPRIVEFKLKAGANAFGVAPHNRTQLLMKRQDLKEI
jgi:hypothetical protein